MLRHAEHNQACTCHAMQHAAAMFATKHGTQPCHLWGEEEKEDRGGAGRGQRGIGRRARNGAFRW